MIWHLQCPDGRVLALAPDSDVTVGGAGNAGLKLSALPERFALLQRSDDDAWLRVLAGDAPVGVNGRPVQSLARLRPGDRICFGSQCVELVEPERVDRAPRLEVAGFALRVRSGNGSGSVHHGPVLHLDGEGEVVSAAAGVVGLILADGAVRLDPNGAPLRLNGVPVTSEVVTVDGDQLQLGQRRYLLETLDAPAPEMVTERLPASDIPAIPSDAVEQPEPVAGQAGGLWGLILLAAAIASGVAILLYFHN